MSTSVCGKRAVSRGRQFFGFLWTVLAAFVLFGAGCTENNTGTGSTASGLILPDGEAWISESDEGYALRESDRTLLYIYRNGNTWQSVAVGTYSNLSENSITVSYDGYTFTGTYSIHGNDVGATVMVTFDGQDMPPIIAVRTRIGITTNPKTDIPIGGGGSLVLGANEAWTITEDGYGFGCIFRANGEFVGIEKDGNYWYEEVTGTWSTSGNRLTITFYDYTETNPYTVSGNKLTVTLFGQTEIFTRTSGVIVIVPPDNPTTPPTPLTEDVWAHANITSNTPNKAVWYSFNVVSGQRYYVLWDDENSGPQNGTLDILIRASYSDGTVIFSEDDWNQGSTPQSFTANRSGTVQIRVIPYSYSDIGTFGVMYTTTNPNAIPPDNPTLTPLTENVWTSGSITSSTPGRTASYSFNAVSGQQYYVLWDDEYSGPQTGTLDIGISVSYSDGTVIFTGDDWGSTPQSFTANRSGTVQIRVTPISSGETGTFRVMYTTTNPNVTPPNNPTLTPLTENVWTSGSITSSTPGRTASYSFNAVSGQKYYVLWDDEYSGPQTGTLDIGISVSYSDGTVIFTEDDWGPTPRSFTANRSGTVQIRVTPIYSSETGTFRVMYTTTDPNGSGGGTGGNLILGANEAWVATEEEMTLGFMFKSNGDFVEIVYMEEEEYGVEGWFGGIAGTWSTSGSSITLTFNYGETYTGVYTVSGNTATIIIEGEPMTFTKTGNIIYEDIGYLMKSPNSGENPLKKILSQKQSSLFKKSSPSKKTLPFKKPSPQKKPVSPGKLSWGK